MKALVTGATSGIGKSIAEKLSNRGWELILTGRNEDMLKAMQEKLGNCEIIAADLSQKSEVLRVYDFCKGKNVDMLVNNAGFGVFGKLSETDLDKELDMINVNIRAVHILMKLFLRDFRKRDRGIILNVASVAGFLTGPLMAAYYASKSYVIKLSHAAAEELRREGVARELVNRIQNIRKESGFEVTDKIRVEVEANDLTESAIASFAEYIAQQTLALDVKVSAAPAGDFVVDSDLDESPLKIAVTKA